MNYILSFLILAEGKIVSDDRVTKVPGWGDKYTGAMYSGYIPINASCNSSMYYWALEKEGGSEAGVTPILLWLNGGPGASSITGLLTENIGPYQITGENTFAYNKHAWTDKYNVLIVDNPVGTGFSFTDDRSECYCGTEKEVAEDFYILLNTFFNTLHPEYATNPFWLVGESYAGKYIPNIAEYLSSKSFPFEGVILGNGLYEPDIQYLTVPQFAFNLGILDQKSYVDMEGVANHCVDLIHERKLHEAAVYCEGMVDTIYGDLGGGVFRYDVRIFYDVLGNISTDMGNYLNSPEVKSALYTTGHTWTDADETGPVADALRNDFTISVMPQLETLLRKGYKVILYNGQMDGSVCNHVGNSKIMDRIKWDGQAEFEKVKQKLWRLDSENVVGYRRAYKNLAYVIIVNSGHLVPMTQPETYRIFLDAAVNGDLA